MKILSYLMKGLFIAIVLFIALLVMAPNASFFGKNELKIVKSGSMEPAIKTGSVVFIRATGDYKEGDVITFRVHGNPVPTTHRIVKIGNAPDGTPFYTTKGDANEEDDLETVSATSVIGKVLFTIPLLGFVLDFARQPLGFSLLIGLPAVLIIINELGSILGEMRRIRKKEGEESYGKEKISITRERIDSSHPFPFTLVILPYKESITEPSSKSEKKYNGGKFAARKTGMSFFAMVIPLFLLLQLPNATNLYTYSYQVDHEITRHNTLRASTYDISLHATTTIVTLPSQMSAVVPVTFSVETVFGESARFLYELNASSSSSFCNSLHAHVENPFPYNGPLLSFMGESDGSQNDISIALHASGNSGNNNSQCELELVVKGFDDALGGGYSDEERISFIVNGATILPSIPSFDVGLTQSSDMTDAQSVSTTTNTEENSMGGDEATGAENEESASTTTPPNVTEQPVASSTDSTAQDDTVSTQTSGGGTAEETSSDNKAEETNSEDEKSSSAPSEADEGGSISTTAPIQKEEDITGE